MALQQALRPVATRSALQRRLATAARPDGQLLLRRLDGELAGVALLTLNRPEARNALSRQLLTELRVALDDLRFDPAVRTLVVASSSNTVFCAGADLKERINLTPQEATAASHSMRGTFLELEQLPMPTIAVLEGVVIGGGMEMALACDFRVAGATARLSYPETALAIIPGAGGTQRLPRLIGVSRAKELLFTSRHIDALAAEKIGLVDYAVDDGKSLDRALELAREILANGPIGVRMAKEAISRGVEVDLTTGLAIERACYAQVLTTNDRVEGLRAFKEKRQPEYEGE